MDDFTKEIVLAPWADRTEWHYEPKTKCFLLTSFDEDDKVIGVISYKMDNWRTVFCTLMDVAKERGLDEEDA